MNLDNNTKQKLFTKRNAVFKCGILIQAYFISQTYVKQIA